MQVTVALFNDVIPVSGSRGDLSSLGSSLPDVKIPRGFYGRITGGERKFIVMKKADDILVAIGPIADGYYHSQLKAVAEQSGFGFYSIAGGGFVEFFTTGGEWRARFKGKSGDFGPYDPIILYKEHRHAIIKALGMDAEFAWES